MTTATAAIADPASDIKITDQEVQFYQKEGYLVIPGLLSTAMAQAIRQEVDKVLALHDLPADRMRQAATGGCTCPPELPCVCDAVQTVRIVRNVPKTPSADEQASDPRARSARLRVVERIEPRSRNDVSRNDATSRR